jgi:UDP-N-acetylmuramate dehydrogenase
VTTSDVAESLRSAVTGRVETDAPLAPFTTFRVGGPADVLVEAETDDDLRALAELRGELPIAIVGKGSNLLVSDDGFRGIAVRLGRGFRDHETTQDGLVLGGAVQLPAAARLTARYGLSGFEFAAEIPGAFGGAVRMNAGAHGRSMVDVLQWASVIDLATGELRTMRVEDLGYAYRHSELRPMDLVTRGEIRLDRADGTEVGERIASYLRWRRENQPSGRSAGSVFKNPPGDSAGRLIDAAGGKGLTVGGAEISSVHANFIVANPGATALDVWTLIRLAARKVRDASGIELEPEVRILGVFPEVEG